MDGTSRNAWQRTRSTTARFACTLLLAGTLLPGCVSDQISRPPPPILTIREPLRRPPPPPQAMPVRAPVIPATAERKVLLGRSVEGRLIEMSVFGATGPSIFIFGGIHGDEPNSADVAAGLRTHLRRFPEDAAGLTVAILPDANPDGLLRHSRTNVRGVDLNRDFPARNWRAGQGRGPRPVSEPETAALMAALEQLRPDVILSIHAISRGRQCNNFDGPANALARLMSRFNNYPVYESIGYTTPGSLGSWAGVDRQIPTITLELPKGQDGEDSWRDNREALLALLRHMRSNANLAK